MAEPAAAAAAHRLLVSARALRRIERRAEAAYPEECCGILVGRSDGPPPGLPVARVERVVPAVNTEEAARRRRLYSIDLRALFTAHKRAREEGLEVVGYYHSHPDHPARPSGTDRERAWPGVSYLIVAVERGRAAGSRCWRLDEARGEFVEGEIGDEP